ncbi:MAG: hypothetical protein J7641_23525 [Cyanobacteria bacterium SID2]|nr:hypothetical protein [Cyanobacteria bacterium SID2]MBP0004154.1 hypothetical protein [Cyanobacteria bacterium SBC]
MLSRVWRDRGRLFRSLQFSGRPSVVGLFAKQACFSDRNVYLSETQSLSIDYRYRCIPNPIIGSGSLFPMLL